MFAWSLTKTKKLVDVLRETGKIKPEQAQAWASFSNAEVEKKVKEEHMISDIDLAKAYAVAYALPFVELKGKEISSEALAAIPMELAREYKIIAYEVKNNSVKVAIADAGKLTENLHEALKSIEDKKKIEIELAVTSSQDLAEALLLYTKIPATSKPPVQSIPIVQDSAKNYKTIDLTNIVIPKEVINKFPEDIAKKYTMVVFDSPHPTLIKVAVADPEDKKVQEILAFVRDKNDVTIEEYKAMPGQIHQAMKYYHPEEIKAEVQAPPKPQPNLPKVSEIKKEEPAKITAEEFKPLPKQVSAITPSKKEEDVLEVSGMNKGLDVPIENNFDEFLKQKIVEPQDLQAIAETGDVPKIVAAAVALAVTKKASDIHIEPAEKNVRIRLRVDGILRDIIKLPPEMLPALISRIKIMSKLKIDESRVPQDGRFDAFTGGHQIDMRVSTLPTVHGEKAAMRILDKSSQIYTLEELGLAGRNLKALNSNIDKPYGIVLATGPTGSGKSTTLYAILNRISTASVNIITLEDPVEYEIPGINQCQIKPKIGFTFANGLRSILRQDPNIIMVGEIRDAETASLATHAALTGHLVLSSLHTNDAAGALPRLINMGIEPFLITSSINAILAQRLVRKLCPKCKKPAHLPEPVQQEISRELANFNLPQPFQFFEGKGCDACDQGYSGRIGIFEVLPMSDQVEAAATQRKPASAIKAEAIKEGMVTMKQDGLIKALKGITSVNEVLRVVAI